MKFPTFGLINLIIVLVSLVESTPKWSSFVYYANTVSENNIGFRLFDLSGKCSVKPNGTAYYRMGSCNTNYASSRFQISNGRYVTLAKQYDLETTTDVALSFVECSIDCSESADFSNQLQYVSTSLMISVIDENDWAPEFSPDFPRSVILDSLAPFHFVLSTPANDRDVDKTSNGKVFYSIVTIDGCNYTPGVSDVFKYDGDGWDPGLRVFRSPPWAALTIHSVVIKATDNVSFSICELYMFSVDLLQPNVGLSKSVNLTLKLIVGESAGAFFPSDEPLCSLINNSLSTTTTTMTSTIFTSTQQISSTDFVTGNVTLIATTMVNGNSTNGNVTSQEDCSELQMVCHGTWFWVIKSFAFFLSRLFKKIIFNSR